jgi:hypothetical protein
MVSDVDAVAFLVSVALIFFPSLLFFVFVVSAPVLLLNSPDRVTTVYNEVDPGDKIRSSCRQKRAGAGLKSAIHGERHARDEVRTRRA